MTIPTLRLSILFILSAGLAPLCQAEDKKIPEIKTSSGKTYHDVQVMKVTPSEISIMHESGVTRIPLKDLPEDLKAKFGYDSVKAEAHATARAQADAQTGQQFAQAAKKQAEAKALMASAKPGIFIVDRYSEEHGLIVYGCTFDGIQAISHWQDQQKLIGEKHVPGKWNILTTGQGDGRSSWINFDKKYILIGLPLKENYLKNSSVGGMFVKAGTAKLDDDTRIQAFRYVGLAKDDNISLETIDR